MDHCTEQEKNEWRNKATHDLLQAANPPKLTITCLNPVHRENVVNNILNRWMRIKTMIKGDKFEIDNSDVVLVHFFPPKHPSFMTGTTMEVLYGYEHDKTIVSVVDKNVVISPWIEYHSHCLTYSLDEAIEYIVRNHEVFSRIVG